MVVNIEDHRAAQSRAAIIEAGVRALLRNPSASYSEIANEAGIGRATLYRHFATREDLIQELARVCLAQTDAALAEIDESLPAIRRIEGAIRAIMPLANRFGFLMSLWTIAEADSMVNAMFANQLGDLSALIEEAKEAGDIHQALDTRWIITALGSLLSGAWQMVERDQGHIDKLTESVARTFMRGIQSHLRPVTGGQRAPRGG